MKKQILFSAILIALSLAVITACGDKGKANTADKPNYKYTYEMAEGDALGAMMYELDNGLKIYMSVNKKKPRVQTNIAVNAGSKQDPASATGLAHYLEHMLFKGTSKIATTNWEEEKKLLDQISDKYEAHRNTKDAAKRKSIYKQIDSLSTLAAALAIPNEYDKMVSSLGAQGTNAYTSVEQTVYINDIPSNEVEKWMKIESERMNELVLRLFHTELETVYEEYNRGLDNDYYQAYYKMMQALFPTHQYGTQSTIGTGEHLKNPSMVKIHEFFSTYYVPNNMALIFAGDINPDEIVDLAKKHFGDKVRKEVPEFKVAEEAPITEVKTVEIQGPNAAFVNMGFRLPGAGTREAHLLTICDMVMSNGEAGLIDINLNQTQKVLNAGSYPNINKDYSTYNLSVTPRDGQSLDEAKGLVLEQIANLKAGNFDDWLLKAVVKDLKRSEMQGYENNRVRAGELVDAFIYNMPLDVRANALDTLYSYSKQDVVDFANKYFLDNNYVVLYKKEGKNTAPKVEKPEITQLAIVRDTASAFLTDLAKMPENRIKPEFIDFKKEIKNDKLASGVSLDYIQNKTNDLFSLYYILDMGSDHDKEMALAIQYLPYLGTEKYSAAELKKELFKRGMSFDVFSGRDRVYISLDGLQEDVEAGIPFFEDILASVKPDAEAYTKMVDGIIKERNDAKKSKFQILYSGLLNQATYGENNPTKNILSTEQLRAINPETLTNKLKELTSYKHKIFFYGPNDMQTVKGYLEQHHKTPETLADYPAPITFNEVEVTENSVIFTDYDQKQTELLMISRDAEYNKALATPSNIFNEYFGAGLSSIVFQEIRESKALAYSAYCFYQTPNKMDKHHYIRAYMGTQSDKMPDAIDAMLELLADMPKAQDQFESSRLAAMKKIETNRTTGTAIYFSYLSAKDKGLDYDLNKDVYKQLPNFTMDNLVAFFDEHIKNHNYTYCVIGKREDVDFEALKKLGPVTELTPEQLFGY